MQTNQNYQVHAYLSGIGYNKKPDLTTTERLSMHFLLETHTIESLANQVAMDGHAITHLFKDKDGKAFERLYLKNKRIDNFYGTQFVIIDVDETTYDTVEGFVCALRKKPSIAYTSYTSNVERNGLKLHLIYVFDAPIRDTDLYKRLYLAVGEEIKVDTNSPYDRHCAEPAHMFFGSWNSNKVVTNIVYSIDDFDYDKVIIETEATDTKDTVKVDGSSNLTEMYNGLKGGWRDLDGFVERWKIEYRYFYRKEGEWSYYEVDGKTYGIQPTSVNYIEQFFPKGKEKVKDGQHRRAKMKKRIAIMRLINNHVREDELFYNSIIDVTRFFEVDDNDLTPRWVYETVKDIMAETIEGLYSKYYTDGMMGKHNKDFIYSGFDKEIELPLKKRIMLTLKKLWCADNYDIRMSRNELKNLFKSKDKQNRMVKKIEAEMGITKIDKEKEIMSKYDPNKSTRENAKIMGVSKSTVGRLLKKFKENGLLNELSMETA